MSFSELASWKALFSVVLAAFTLGAAPVFTIRCIARVYPKGHDRRRGIVSEMAHAQRLSQTLKLWRWLGEQFATAICVGVPARWATRKDPSSKAPLTDQTPAPYWHVNSKGIAHFLHKTELTLRGGQPQTVYFFATMPKNGKGVPVGMPAGREVRENPNNGFLAVVTRRAVEQLQTAVSC